MTTINKTILNNNKLLMGYHKNSNPGLSIKNYKQGTMKTNNKYPKKQ